MQVQPHLVTLGSIKFYFQQTNPRDLYKILYLVKKYSWNWSSVQAKRPPRTLPMRRRIHLTPVLCGGCGPVPFSSLDLHRIHRKTHVFSQMLPTQPVVGGRTKTARCSVIRSLNTMVVFDYNTIYTHTCAVPSTLILIQ